MSNGSNNDNKKRGVLLGTFVTGDDSVVDEIIQKILSTFSLTNKYIFVLKNKDEENKTLLTFNAEQDRKAFEKMNCFTLRLHRKKQSNTLYTINGLNHAIAAENDGKTGKHLKLDWDKYKNTILLSYNKNLKVIKLDLEKILEVEY
jgi:hypothetical protein